MDEGLREGREGRKERGGGEKDGSRVGEKGGTDEMREERRGGV